MSSDDEFHACTRTIAMQALELSLQEWGSLLCDKTLYEDDEDEHEHDEPHMLEFATERVLSLIVVRLVAIGAPIHTFTDLSTSTICRDLLMGNDHDRDWSAFISVKTIHEARGYVTKILSLYRDVPFHNISHAVHVVVSANKLLEFILSQDFWTGKNQRPSPTFGLQEDPIALSALIFAALIHDVDHAAISNTQRAITEPKLALQYNDQSLSENHSLFLAFQELLLPKYKNFYKALFPIEYDYQRFRMLVVDSVLSTDIASPERVQISKSKWKEAFEYEQQRRQRHQESNKRRGSIASQISMPKATRKVAEKTTTDSSIPILNLSRRLSNGSDHDSVAKLQARQRGVPKTRSCLSYDDMVNQSDEPPTAATRRQRLSRRQSAQSYQSNDSSASYSSLMANSVVLAHKREEGAKYTRLNRFGTNHIHHAAPDKSNGDEGDSGSIVRRIQYEYNDDDDDDSSGSLSLTPPSSEDGGVMIYGIPGAYTANLTPPVRADIGGQPFYNTQSIEFAGTSKSHDIMRGVARRASTGNLPRRLGSLLGSTIDENKASGSNRTNALTAKNGSGGRRRMSMNCSSRPDGHFKKRLGLRRSMDLSGEAVEIYQRRGSLGDMSAISTLTEMQDTKKNSDYDEPDDLKAAVVIEVLLRASDVAHNLQYFDNMTKWMSRLYKELLLAHKSGRGFDPRPCWFDNQCHVIESYLIPLVSQLNEMGIFGAETGLSFANILENNLDSWNLEGRALQNEWSNIED